MPNRILRDWTDSEKVNSLSDGAEVFFTRLIMKCDDYGRHVADNRLLLAAIFPLKLDKIKIEDINSRISECVKADLLFIYEVNNRKYLQINNFGQRLRQMKSKCPAPTDKMTAECQHNDSNPPSIVLPETKRIRNESETETNKNPLPPNGSKLPWVGVASLKHCKDEAEKEFAEFCNRIFKRRESTQWSKKEISAFKQIQDFTDDELELLGWYYERSGCKYVRQDLLTFLNNFRGEIDRAQRLKEEKNRPGKSKTIWV